MINYPPKLLKPGFKNYKSFYKHKAGWEKIIDIMNKGEISEGKDLSGQEEEKKE